MNARLFGRDDLGRIAEGSAGDAVVFEADPFEDPSALWTAAGRTVVSAGQIVTSAV